MMNFTFSIASEFPASLRGREDRARRAIIEGLQLWEATGLVKFSYDDGDPDLSRHLFFYFGSKIESTADAQTMQRLGTGDFAKVQFNSQSHWGLWTSWFSIFEPGADANLKQTTAHEVGHCMWLNHPVEGIASIMQPVGYNQSRKPTAYDIANLKEALKRL